MDQIAVIELGEVPAGAVADERPPRPWPHRRSTFVAVASALALVTLGASAPVARPLPMAVLDVPDTSDVLATNDRIFVVDRDPSTNGPDRDRHVTAYRLMDLAQLWQIDLPVHGAEVSPLFAADTIVLSRLDTPDGQVSSGPETAAVDAVTGAILWRHDGSAEGWTAAGNVLMSFDGDGPAVAGEPDPPGQVLRAVAARTGHVLWSADVPAGTQRTYRADGDRLALLALVLPGGRVELRDPDTWALGDTRQLAAPAGAGTDVPAAEIVGDLLLVREPTAASAYDLDRLDLRWRVPLPAGQIGWPRACGEALCLADERNGLRSVDPRTGHVRWSDRRWMMLGTAGGSLVVGEFDPRTDGLWLAAVDPGTGQLRKDLGLWDGIDYDSTEEWLFGFQFDQDRAVVSRIDAARGANVLGVVHGVGRNCRTQRPLLLCRRTDHTLGIWRLPG